MAREKDYKDFAKRDEVVIATKVHGKMHDGPNGAGLSRKAILSEIDNSLNMHTAFVICGGVLVLGLVSAWVFMSEHDRRHPKVDSVEKPRRTTRPAETALGRREKSG